MVIKFEYHKDLSAVKYQDTQHHAHFCLAARIDIASAFA
jgi:hypothetical protein